MAALKGDRHELAETGEGMYSFFLRDSVKVEMTNGTGNGVVAARDIAKGTLIWQSDPEQNKTEVASLEEILEMQRDDRIEWAEYTWFIGGYFFGPKRDRPISEATQMEATNLINHSCSPNIGFAGDHHLVTLRDIKAGEPINTDYAMTEWKAVNWDTMECGCGAANCRKQITWDDWRKPEVMKVISGHCTSSVQRMIDLRSLPDSYFGTGGMRELSTRIEVRPHPKFPGHGLFAKDPIAAGELLWRHNGVDCKQYDTAEVMATTGAEKEFLIHYGYQVDEHTWSAPLSLEWMKAGNDDSSYMNHSCDPTVYLLTPDMWVARRDIAAGEELCYDYAMSETVFDRLPECLCGAPECRGKVTKDDWKIQDLRRRYLLSFSDHVLAMMAKEDRWLLPQNTTE